MKIPRSNGDDGLAPAWMPMVDGQDRPHRPAIRCACGAWMGIGRHHVHADGRVTASFLHPECGFHEFLELADYADGEFPPEPQP